MRRALWLLPAIVAIAVPAVVRPPSLLDRPATAASHSPSPSPSQSPSPSVSPSPSQSPSPSASPSPSPTPTGPNFLSIAVTPSIAVWGTTFKAAGALICFGSPIAGATVVVQRRIGGTFTFQTIGQSVTGTSGGYAVLHRPDRSADYRAVIPTGTGPCGVSGSKVARGDVRPGVSTNVTRTPLPRGATAELRGTVAPAHAGRKVYLQVFQGSTRTWANASVAALDSSSRFRLTYRRTSAGALLFRVVYPTQDTDHAWNIGRNVRIDWT